MDLESEGQGFHDDHRRHNGVKCFSVVMDQQPQTCVCGVKREDVVDVDVCRHLDVTSVGIA